MRRGGARRSLPRNLALPYNLLHSLIKTHEPRATAGEGHAPYTGRLFELLPPSFGSQTGPRTRTHTAPQRTHERKNEFPIGLPSKPLSPTNVHLAGYAAKMHFVERSAQDIICRIGPQMKTHVHKWAFRTGPCRLPFVKWAPIKCGLSTKPSWLHFAKGAPHIPLAQGPTPCPNASGQGLQPRFWPKVLAQGFGTKPWPSLGTKSSVKALAKTLPQGFRPRPWANALA